MPQGEKMKSIKFKLLMFIGITVLIFSSALLYRTHRMVTTSVENQTRQELAGLEHEHIDERILDMIFSRFCIGK